MFVLKYNNLILASFLCLMNVSEELFIMDKAGDLEGEAEKLDKVFSVTLRLNMESHKGMRAEVRCYLSEN